MPEKTDPDDNTRSYTLDDLRGRTPDEIRDAIDVTKAQIRDLMYGDNGELRTRDDAEDKALEHLLQVHQRAEEMYEEHRNIREVLERRPKAIEYSRLGGQRDDPYSDVRRLSFGEARDRALRSLDDRGSTGHLDADQRTHIEKQARRDTDIARRILVTENDDYRSGWMKLVTHPQGAALLTNEERQAIQAFQEYRAMSEGVTTAGGFGIPVFIDPSIIMTAQGSGNPFLTIAAQKTVTTSAWKGVSSAGVTWSFDAEAAEVSDDSPTLAQPSVPLLMARGFLPFSIEVGQDYPGFAEEMSQLLSEGYDELLVDKFTRGSGSGEPQGILTALSANTNVRVRVTTAGTIGSPDPYKVWKALGQRFRRRASWLMSVDANNALRQLGTANVFHAYTENLPAEWADQFFGKQAYESPYMPDTTSSTSATDGIAVVGDFQNYVVARRAGMSVELVQHLIGLTNNRPTGQRGWFAYARIGGGSANDLGFRLLVNT
jgi:HK97 family phage major capsid protein